MNVVIHSLLHVPPLREYLLLSNFRGKESELVKRFAGLAKKLWNPRLFKSQVSPHEFLQEVNRVSAGRYSLEKQGDPVEFLGWLLHHLHKDMGGTKKQNSSEFPCRTGGNSRITDLLYRRHLRNLPGRSAGGDSTSPCAPRHRGQ